ncbi:MAG: ferredoxin, partial [Alphaproteobacteria bacterium]|nr:ferredoxin [Alphaproteobacteria bacterium]
ACVSTCPASARHFGDLGDPNSEVSILVKEREGYDLMPQMGYKPTNKYLPPRPRRDRGGENNAPTSLAALAAQAQSEASPNANGVGGALLRWVDTVLSR